MRYKCLVLDHDDTVVRSTDQIHYPSFLRSLAVLRPGYTLSLEDYLRYSFSPGFRSFAEDILGFTPEEMELEVRFWREDVAKKVPEVFSGIKPILERFRREGGHICVASHSMHDNILRDYRENGLPEPELVFGWDLPQEQVKPQPYALDVIMQTFGLTSRELVMVDDLKPGMDMAKSRNVDFLAAGWAFDLPQFRRVFEDAGVPYLRTVAELEGYLFS